MQSLATNFRTLGTLCGERCARSVTELARVTVGLGLVLGVLRVINFAQGECLMLNTPGGAAIVKRKASYV